MTSRLLDPPHVEGADPGAEERPHAQRHGAAWRRPNGGAQSWLWIAAAVATVMVGAQIMPIPAGIFLLFVLPTWLIGGKIDWPDGTRPREVLLTSLGAVIFAIMAVGLLINSVLPVLGVDRPLDRAPVLITLAICLSSLALWRRDRWRLLDGLPTVKGPVIPRIRLRDHVMLIGGALTLVTALAGAIRLNNGASGTVTLVMLFGASAVVLGLLIWRTVVAETTIMATIYLIALSLLLMTSFRGWLTSGHDVQREFRVFQIAVSDGSWNMEVYQNAYNACLSITILPTVIRNLTGIPDIFVYKTVFAALYALCPVIIYLIARRFGTSLVGILSVVYFIAFPTFFTDMPFLNRQIVAFFFLGLILLVATNTNWPIRTRRTWVTVFGVGIILSHYSTTYVVLAIFAATWIYTRLGSRIADRISRRKERNNEPQADDDRTTEPSSAETPVVINGLLVAVLAALTVLWVGPITNSGSQVERTASSTIDALSGAGNQRSSDSQYSIFGGVKVSPEERMQQYLSDSEKSGGADREGLYPLDEVRKYPLTMVPNQPLPPTEVGRPLENVGVDVQSLNATIRRVLPVLMQLFIGLGLIVVLLGRARGFRPNREYVGGAFAALTAVVAMVLLPTVSVDYGILRMFAQGLFWLAPFIAVGSVAAFGWLGKTTAVRISIGLATFTFMSLTGSIPQLIGGNLAQLHLNNSGSYYNNFYLHPQELAGLQWMGTQVDGSNVDVQSEVASDRYVINRMSSYTGASGSSDILPITLQKDAYAFFGDSGVKRGTVSFLYSGDLVTYRYPMDFLDQNKSLIYNNGGGRVYR